MVGAQGRARKQAEEMVLGEMVYLPKEPGTEDLETAADLPPAGDQGRVAPDADAEEAPARGSSRRGRPTSPRRRRRRASRRTSRR
jgi:hypothetical protein